MPGLTPGDLRSNFSSASRSICGVFSMTAVFATVLGPAGADNRASRREGLRRRRRTRLSMLDVPDPMLGPEHPVLGADPLDFPENSTRRCSWLYSVRRRAGDRVSGCEQQTPNA